MSFSSRRRNYLLTPHRRDGLIEWMKSMLHHSFVLDALETSAADTFSHFEMLIDEHRAAPPSRPSRLKQMVPTVGVFHTRLPLRKAFLAYNQKYAVTKRKHVCVSFNEIRQILNLAQIMALRETACGSPSFPGPRMITLDGDQTLYADGANFESNPTLAFYLDSLLRHGVMVAVVTAAGYEYQTDKYHVRLSGLLEYFRQGQLPSEACQRFFLFGGECNYLLQLHSDYQLHPVEEYGETGWLSVTRHVLDSPANWKEEQVTQLLDDAESCFHRSIQEQNIRGRVLRKKRSVGLIPLDDECISREALDETVLRVQALLQRCDDRIAFVQPRCEPTPLPFCAFNGGKDCWVDVGNKRVGVTILSTYLNIPKEQMLHIGDQFLNTGNDFAARDVCPCVWIISPVETTFILKNILRLAQSSWLDDDDTCLDPTCSNWLVTPKSVSIWTEEGHDGEDFVDQQLCPS
jgi:IMP and pyridine-specific 5'-nucleotidase